MQQLRAAAGAATGAGRGLQPRHQEPACRAGLAGGAAAADQPERLPRQQLRSGESLFRGFFYNISKDWHFFSRSHEDGPWV